MNQTILTKQTKMGIIKDKIQLSKPVQPGQYSQEDIQKITNILTTALNRYGGIGLSANQIGLDARACIINVKEPLVLINPVIVKRSEDNVAYVESSLSVDKSLRSPVKTVRSKEITVECDNLGTVMFAPDAYEGIWADADEFFSDAGLLETAIAQQVIDLLDGVLITHPSRRYTQTVTKSKTYGRNEMVMIQLPDGKTEFIKYKKAQSLLDVGGVIL